MPIDNSLTGDAPGGGSSGGDGGGLGSIISGLAMAYGVYQGARNQDKQNAYNREAASTEFARNKEMWDLQNQYNSPEAQMARYKAAGLNPNLIYGSGGSAGNASSAPVYHAPQQSFAFNPASSLMQVIPMYQDFKLRQAQIDNVQANTEQTRAKTVTEGLVQGLKGIGIDTAETKLGQSRELFPYQLSIKKGEASRQEGMLLQQWKKLALMTEQEKLMALQKSYLENRVSQQGVENERKQADLLYAKYRNDWMKMGVTSGDNVILRIFTRMLSGTGLVDQAIQSIKKVKP